MNKIILNLFNAVLVDTKRKKKIPDEILKATINRGFIFTPEVFCNYENNITDLVAEVESVIGISGEKANNSFHKSWAKIRDAEMDQLVAEQIIHYITTYGFEELGIYNEESVYIPAEKLEVPELTPSVTLTVVKGYTKTELRDKLVKFLSSGIALKEDTVKDVVDLAVFLEFTDEEIKQVKNKEVKASLYDYLNIAPKNPVEFLRFVIFKSTGSTLLIKSNNLIESIKISSDLNVVKRFQDYEKLYGLERLSEIFYRFKPLFLAFREDKKLRKTINRLRRLAKVNHKPLPEDYLNTITSKIKNNVKIDKKELVSELSKVNTFRKIRLAYALKFRTKDAESILYRIRNGKGFADEFSFDNKEEAGKILKVVIDSIVEDVKENVKGKQVYLPEFINYALPATEKQFTGNIPSGSFVSVPNDMVVGVYWENFNGRIDLDLSLISKDEKYGWDSSYRNDERDILFSGDVTDAPKPNGASELFYVKRQNKNAFIIMNNYYNYRSDNKVPFKIFVAKENAGNMKENYMVDPNNIMAVANSSMDKKQKSIGLLVTTTNESRFYFAETYIGDSISSRNSDSVKHSRNYLFDFYENSISFKDILEKAGVELVEDREEADIDLSLETLEKDTIINLLTTK